MTSEQNTSNVPLNRFLQGECGDEMDNLPVKCVDMIFADPPYNLQLQQELRRPNMSVVDAVNDEWDSFASFEEYDTFTLNWLSSCRRVLKDSGTIWVIGTYHNIHRVGRIMMDLGFWIINEVVWVKSNPMPNFRGVRFTNAHETILWAKKSKEQKKYTFNYQTMKAMNDGKQMRSDWRLPICSGNERLRDENGKVHSTQKPEALLERIILSSSNRGDVILDPFSGSGTTAAVAKRYGRNWIGIERDSGYIKAASERLANVQEELGVADLNSLDVRPPKVAFKKLVGSNLLHANSKIYFDRDERRSAIVLPDGTIDAGGTVGSIHKVGASLAGWPACNGWDHWYTRDDSGNYHVIDSLRSAFLESTRQQESG